MAGVLQVIEKYVFGIFFAVPLCYASVKDMQTYIIPDRTNLALLILGALRIITKGLSPPDAILGMMLCGIPFLTAAIISDGVGGGDVKLFFCSGFFLGLNGAYFALISSLILFLIFYMIFRLFKRRNRGDRIAFAPFITFGSIFSYLIGVILN